ncbi:hypothetical protein BDM02DRAFT_3129260 [Thelephora ganbajun]|uniref:Uncharacterized protein n=1 Tax=Thelephora ganbajun TaxID=370292 RepID=A0ACB6ZEE4_THEGA|nr:hypothetical protein BDM02DRAFT_3129260 [Thelephora ganbajun]
MDDQGAGGSSRSNRTNPERRPVRESSLPATLLPHLYHAPRHISSPGIAPLTVPDWPNQSTRSRSQDHGRSLPSPSHLLRQTESTFDYDHVILSRSLDASPVNPTFVTNPDLPPPRLALQRPLPPVDDPPQSTRDRPMGGYSYPMTRSMSTSPFESPSRSYSHASPYGHEPVLRTPQPPQLPSRRSGSSPGIQDVFMEDVGVLPQPEVPIRPPRDTHAELRHSPGFAQEQRRGRSEVRATYTSQRVLQRQVEPLPSQSTRERRPPTSYTMNPVEEQQRLQLPPSQPQLQQVRHQPQPQQPARFSQLLSGPGYQVGIGASSSSQSTPPSRGQTTSSFPGGLYSEGRSEIKSLYQGSSMAEHPAIETQEAVSERKEAQRSPAVKEPGTPTEEGASTSTSTGATTSTRRKPSTKVTVACDFCRGRKLRCDGERPCSNCSGRGTECTYQPGGPRRRGPGKAPKKTRAESSRQRQQQQQRQQAQQQPPLDQSQMSISVSSPGSSGPSPITIVPAAGIIGGGSPLTPGGRVTTGPRFPSQSPGASTSEMETGSQAGSRRRLSGSSVEEPERKRSRIRELEGEGKP